MADAAVQLSASEQAAAKERQRLSLEATQSRLLCRARARQVNRAAHQSQRHLPEQAPRCLAGPFKKDTEADSLAIYVQMADVQQQCQRLEAALIAAANRSSEMEREHRNALQGALSRASDAERQVAFS